MGKMKKKIDDSKFFLTFSSYWVIFSYKGHQNWIIFQISGHLVLFLRFCGCLKLENDENLNFFMHYLNCNFSTMAKDIEKKFSVPNSNI